MRSVYSKYSRHNSEKLEPIFGHKSGSFLFFPVILTSTAIILIESPKAYSQNASDLLLDSETTIITNKSQQFLSVEEAESETIPSAKLINPTVETKGNKDYYIPPRIIPKEKVHPLTTTLPLNSIPIDLGSRTV